MRLPFRFLACAGLALMASACATFGTNVEGSFQCRAPKGNCAPSHVLDARATNDMTTEKNPLHATRPAMAVAAGDRSRTSERTLRIVFPARVDEAGTLHDEAVAWAVIENPRWAAELRRKPGDQATPPLMRQLKRQLKAVQATAQTAAQKDNLFTADGMGEASALLSDRSAPDVELLIQPDNHSDLFPLVSPPVSPSPADETATGADAPVAGGLHATASPHDPAPRLSNTRAPLNYPSIEAIEAAKRGAATSNEPPEKEQN
ncbi:conjugal transfer protein TraV [Porphyrobacter sp. CACIAM 03H1]|uniref:conjugal transfer protein TraV n=1 Tax=Porphyrobacter sp. CACIAM 03H1 TaxID=2003315 RepID=UPI000B5A7D43|nr:conjugal transfer protein TraV [Porphyrobacter sp. CACIAM 03H1]ASJ91981.1 conjugal transfer protein TraV [Porphyrobacter sp. CACIAM 03H1]